MKTVHEVSAVSGVSVRTLHHYDAIGLLKPTAVTDAGYRLYDDTALLRLQSILLFRELQFPLREIREIIDSPRFDRRQALEDQIVLLELQKEHVENVISLARKMMNEGETVMDFSVFDKSTQEQYTTEAKERWGGTEAYRESEVRGRGRSMSEQARLAAGLMEVFAKFGALRESDPAADKAQALVKELQQYITDHYYTCTPEILRGLGAMYVADERFTASIDGAGGEGTAEFVNRAIECRG